MDATPHNPVAEKQVKAIRRQLRLAMNGVVSTSMREKGMVYALNYGVPYLEVKRIAAGYEPDADLAAALWREDIREFKLLAALLQPPATFTQEQAWQWAAEIRYTEPAELCSKHLFSKLPFADTFARELLARPDLRYARTLAFLIWGERFRAGLPLPESDLSLFLTQAIHSVSQKEAEAPLKERMAALFALKAYGRQSALQGEWVLSCVEQLPDYTARPDLQEIGDDLKFEFEYYR